VLLPHFVHEDTVFWESGGEDIGELEDAFMR
jgi:hypothetical protein